MRPKMKVSNILLVIITGSLIYACVIIYLMMKLPQHNNPYDDYTYVALISTPPTISTETIEEMHIMRSKLKPRVFGYYFNHSLSSKVNFHQGIGFHMASKVITQSILNEKRKPMKLPVYWENALYELYPTKRTMDDWSVLSEKQDLLANSKYYDKHSHNPLRPYKDFPECIAMHEWQKKSFPTCNLIHETADLTHMIVRKTRETKQRREFDQEDFSLQLEHKRLLAHGYFRDTFVIADQHVAALSNDASSQQVAFKTLRLQRNYDAWIYDRHRMDALVMDRMVMSDHIVDIYGYCGAAGFYEFGEGDMANLIRLETKNDIFSIREKINGKKYLKRLKYAVDVANAIADLHTIESYKDGMFSAIVHADVHMTQFVWTQGKFKLNDFNRCHFMFWNKTSNNESCPYTYLDHNAGIFRSPEEYAYSLQTEEIDVFSMGNIFYFLLTDKEPFGDLRDIESTDYVKDLILNGTKPELSEEILEQSDNPCVAALIEAMDMCHVIDYQERASASIVRDFLIHRMEEIQKRY